MEENEGRNFLIFLAVVFVTTVIALIVVLSVTWRWIAEPVGSFFESVGRFQNLQELDYNFEIPESEDAIAGGGSDNDSSSDDRSEDSEEDSGPQYDYVFNIPLTSFNRSMYRFKGTLERDAIANGYGTEVLDLTEVLYSVQIPKIGLSSQAYSGLGEDDLLEKGFWILPQSGDTELGEIGLLCYSRFFFPGDKRSCEYMNNLEIGDKVYVQTVNEIFEYEVYDTDVKSATDEEVYFFEDSESEEGLLPAIRIISNVTDQDNRRIVVYAELNEDFSI